MRVSAILKIFWMMLSMRICSLVLHDLLKEKKGFEKDSFSEELQNNSGKRLFK